MTALEKIKLVMNTYCYSQTKVISQSPEASILRPYEGEFTFFGPESARSQGEDLGWARTQGG